MEELVRAAAELRRRIKVQVADVEAIRCHLVITEKSLVLEPVQLKVRELDMWTPVDVMVSSAIAVIVAHCPESEVDNG